MTTTIKLTDAQHQVLAHAADQAWRNHRGQHAEDDDHHDDLDKRKAPGGDRPVAALRFRFDLHPINSCI